MAKRKKKTTPVQSIDIRIMDIQKEVNKTLLRHIIQNAREAGCFGGSLWKELEDKTGLRAEFIRSVVFLSDEEIESLATLRLRMAARAIKELATEDQPLYDKDEARLADPQILDRDKYSSRAWRTRIETAVHREGRYAEEDDEISEGGVTEEGVVIQRGGTPWDGRGPDAEPDRTKNMWVKASYAISLRVNKRGKLVKGGRLFNIGDLWNAWRAEEGPKPRELISGLCEHVRLKRDVLRSDIRTRVSERWSSARAWVAKKLYKNKDKSEEDMAEWVRFARKFIGDGITMDEGKHGLVGLDGHILPCPLHRVVKKQDKRFKEGFRLIKPDCEPMLDWLIHAIEKKGVARELQPIGEALILAEDVCGADSELFNSVVDFAKKHDPKNAEDYDLDENMVRRRVIAFVVFYDAVAAGQLTLKAKYDPETKKKTLVWEEQDATDPHKASHTTGPAINPLMDQEEGGPTQGRLITLTEEGELLVEPLPGPSEPKK